MSHQAVLMGNPDAFQIRGGANPHTRDAWGRKKKVNLLRAQEQWHRLARTLVERGVTVYVMPAVPTSPGLVFPANAGFLTRAEEAVPPAEKTFYLSRALPSRMDESFIDGNFVKNLGFRVESFETRFEGEADFFHAGDYFIFTSGVIVNQRFVPRLGWPPYKRLYGFRSSPHSVTVLASLVHGKSVLPLTLTRETHYHGDTCLCSFGREREFLMVYEAAIDAQSRALLVETFKDNLIYLSEEDGENFAANSFQIESNGEKCLLMPHNVSEKLKGEVRERGVIPIGIDVSEFMQKGGGSVKCMIGDLGIWPEEETDLTAAVIKFRHERDYRILYPQVAP